MRITKILIKDFRAFRGEYCIDLSEGKNLLIYGENGSGKTSLYRALDFFLAPQSVDFLEHRNIFIDRNDGYVKLEIGDGESPSSTYEWEETVHPSNQPIVVEASKVKGFLDYKSLLETSFIHRLAPGINVFNLLVEVLIGDIPNPVTRTPFREEWSALNRLVSERRSKARSEMIRRGLADFNSGLVFFLEEVGHKANEILTLFDQSCTISFDFDKHGPRHNGEAKAIDNQVILLNAEYYGQEIARPQYFLNEARLSAIGLSVFLGALLLHPRGRLSVLCLDDVLIGLDMSNRLPLIDVLQRFFSDWQIILMTYDRVWFEMSRKRVEAWEETWECAEFFCRKSAQGDIPVYQKFKDYLSIARHHLVENDFVAAAIYIRSSFERELKQFCDKFNLKVRYYANPKRHRSEDFWQVVRAQKLKDDRELLDLDLKNQIELFRTSILNPLSHHTPMNPARGEVEGALEAVDQLADRLRAVKREDLA